MAESAVNIAAMKKITKRKLHFIFLLDTSKSMEDDGKISQLNLAVINVVKEINGECLKHGRELSLRVIRFSNTAEWIIGDANDGISFATFKNKWNGLKAAGQTATASAIHLLTGAFEKLITRAEELKTRTVPPVCVLISDGICTEESGKLEREIEKLNEKNVWGKNAVRVAIAVGTDELFYNMEELEKFTNVPDGVFVARTAREIERYIKYVSVEAVRSVSTSSKDPSKNSDSNAIEFNSDNVRRRAEADGKF